MFGIASLGWLLAERWLPGGRWVVVHLFTLGVLTGVVVAFTRHFAASFTGQGAPADRRGPLVAAGVVGGNLVVLRRARRDARAPRFTWIVRRYEDAHLAFLVAASLGTALGIGAVGGAWYLGVRDAHMHLNVLGWAGSTVPATLVVFGPAMLRARKEPGGDGRAATALRAAAVALLVAAGGLVVAAGVDGPVGVAARVVATAGLLGYGAAVLVIVGAVLGAARSSDRSPVRWLVAGAAAWLPVGVALDVVVVATTQRPVLNVGVAAVAAGIALAAWADVATAPLVRGGWTLIGLGVLAQLLPMLWPVGPVDPGEVRSATSARYRTPAGDDT